MRPAPTRRGMLRLPAITERHLAAHRYIVKHLASKGRGPLIKEIRAEFDLDTDNSAQALVTALKRVGLVRTTGYTGGIELTAP